MKRINAIISILLAAIFVFACTKPPLPKGDKEIAENSTLYANNGKLAIKHDDALYFNARIGEYVVMYAADLANGGALPACGKPDCLHNDASCNACIGGAIPNQSYTIYNGRFYWVAAAVEDSASEYYLYSMALDGTDRKIEMKLNRDYESVILLGVSGIYDGMLYRCGTGNYVENAEIHCVTLIYAQPLQGGEPKEIMRLDGGDQLAVKFDGHTIYCASAIFSEDILRLHSYDMENDELKELYSGKAPADAIAMTVDGSDLIFQEGRGVSYLMNAGSFSELFPNAPIDAKYSITDTACVDFTLDELVCTDHDGNLIAKLPLKCDWLDETVIKYKLGSIDGVFYFYFCSIVDKPFNNYLVSFDPSEPKLNLIWKG